MRELQRRKKMSKNEPNFQDLKTEYIIKQLGRTKNKKYEMYVVNRIINLIDDFDIKFVTQQYISRPERYALVDLYFPQFNICIEIDEPHHKNNVKKDEIRESDIINATGFDEPIHVDVDMNIDGINNQIAVIVQKVKNLKLATKDFKAWDINKEFNPQTYIDLGFIDIKDNIAFHNISDACNCFGHNYKGYQRGGAKHAINKDILIWFPKLYENDDWNNSINSNENIITEKHKTDKTMKKVENFLVNEGKYPSQRIVFARVKDNLGNVLYRFRGMYKFDSINSSLDNGRIWNRINTRVDTVPASAKVHYSKDRNK